jgi:hypothetical protein
MKSDRFLILAARLDRMDKRQWHQPRSARRSRRLNYISHENEKVLDRHLQRCDRWKHRGKEARRAGLPCQCLDGRLSAIARLSFVLGWQEQDRLMQPAPSPEHIRQNEEFFASLRAECQAAAAAVN